MNRDQAKELIEKYNQGLANAREKAWIENWYLHESRKYEFPETESNFLELKDEIWMATLQNSGLGVKPARKPFRIWPGIAAAAVLLMVIAAGLYFYTGSNSQKNNSIAAADDVAPGGNKAILTLADGKKIVLNDAANGKISEQPGISVSKSAEGQLVYTLTDDKEAAENRINTITTPKGGQYTVILSDGTRVMLNSASSLSFPASFKNKDRVVELNGEAYFEVSKHAGTRFSVISGLQTVEVLGTHFNVNAYADEQSIKTTLLEGAVKVSNAKASALIKPGEQAVVNRLAMGTIVTRNVNTARETAWINGVFSFDNDDLKSVMRQVSRWYDLDVVYVGEQTDEKFFGEISRNSRLSAVFKILGYNNVQFELNGKTLKVSHNQRSSPAINPK